LLKNWNVFATKVPTLKDESATYQVVGGVMDHLALDGYGPWEG
jgi:hypothetical protein